MRRLQIGLVLAALTVTLLVVTPDPARAASGRTDPRDAAAAIDTRRVRLFPNFRRAVIVQMYSFTYNAGRKFNGLDIAYDTRGNRRADYRLIWNFRKDGDGHQLFGLYRANGSRTGARVTCPGMSGKGRDRIHAIEVAVPRACMAIGKRVGIQTQTWNYTRYNRRNIPVRGFRDRAPNGSSYLR